MRVLACPDKFRGTATASEIARAVGAAARGIAVVDEAPMADGGEGTLEALGGSNRESAVTGPLGLAVMAEWGLRDGVAVIEMARASGLELAGGASGNRPIEATTAGTGELIAEAVGAGANTIIVAVGGSATTDGGIGALEAMPPRSQMAAVKMVVACDVRTRFVDAAAVFGPQKGATAAQVEFLTHRLRRLAQTYKNRYGVDVTRLEHAGAAGGLAGGLAVRGAQLVDGFKFVAEATDLRRRIQRADLVITGEGRYDATSLKGKVVGGVTAMAANSGKPVIAVVGTTDPAAPVPDHLTVLNLTQLFGPQQALTNPHQCVQSAITKILTSSKPTEHRAKDQCGSRAR